MQPVRINANSKKTYAPPNLRRLTLQQAKNVLGSKIKNIFSLPRSKSPKVIPISSKSKKLYRKPDYQQLTPEQIKLILIAQFNMGDENAGDLLDQLFAASHIQSDLNEELG